MHLIYLDESGNTGCNLSDTQQPVFVLCALIVPEDCWQELESDLLRAVVQTLGDRFGDGDEIHAADLRTGHGIFADMEIADRLILRDNWFAIAKKH